MDKFKLVSKFKPTGDQPQAIEKLAEGVYTTTALLKLGEKYNVDLPIAKAELYHLIIR